jgi:hypothetical protein
MAERTSPSEARPQAATLGGPAPGLVRILHSADWQIGKPYKFVDDPQKRFRLQEERLRAIVDRLPKTANGVPIVPGMDVWFPSPTPHCVAVWRVESDGIMDTVFHGHAYRKCCGGETYSTREAAEAAKEGEK